MTRGQGLQALRLLAAAMVVLGHSYVITGGTPPRLLGIEVHVLGVHVFFTISGYLITGSWQADPSVARFALRRVLRIMPALMVLVALTVLVVGPAATTLDLRAYAGAQETRLYLWNAALAPYYALPGVFQDGRPFTAVNGSLWTLPIEAAMYAAVPLLGGRAGWARLGVLPAAAVGGCAAGFVFTVLRPDQVQPVVWWSSVPFGLRFAGDFALGALVRSWRWERWLDRRVAAAGLVTVALLPWAGAQVIGAQLAVPYAVLAFGLGPLPGLLQSWASPRSDISYGLYLWGCPVQQLVLSWLGAGIGPYGLTAVALALAGIIGWGSWRLVEQPFLALKPASRG